MHEKELRRELIALHVKTVSARSEGTDLDLMLEIYLHELQNFPGDVVRDVLHNWPGKYFPAWAELREAIVNDRRIRDRRQRIAALEAFAGGHDSAPDPKPKTTYRNFQRRAGVAE